MMCRIKSSLKFQQTLPIVWSHFSFQNSPSLCEWMQKQQFPPTDTQSNRQQRCFENQHWFPNKMSTTKGSDLKISPLKEKKNQDVTVAWQPLHHKTFSINSKSFVTIASFTTVVYYSRPQNLPMLDCSTSDISESNLQLQLSSFFPGIEARWGSGQFSMLSC